MWFELKPIIALAPMADMTDGPFGRVCREVTREACHPERSEGSPGPHLPILTRSGYPSFGRRRRGDSSSPTKSGTQNDSKKSFVIFREMVSAEAIIRGNAKTLKMCEFVEIERPLVQQIFGANPDSIAKAAAIIMEKFHPDGIDINMGCPVPKIAGKGLAGAALMKDHERAARIVKSVKAACAGVPLSVKTRLGWSRPEEILEFAPKLEAAGADVIVIHGRTKAQGYSGRADWEIIGKAKQKLKIPVIANGDIKSREDIARCLEITGADGVMLGRAALGNPWIFRQFLIFNFQFSIQDLIRVVLRHAELHLVCYGERGIVTFRKHLGYYFKGVRVGGIASAAKFRSRLMRVSSLRELKDTLKF